MQELQKEHISKVSLIAFTRNDIGNAFWKQIGWTKREDLNYYDFYIKYGKILSVIMKGEQEDKNETDYRWNHCCEGISGSRY